MNVQPSTIPLEEKVSFLEKKIEFLRKLQKLLSEGSFVASYKYALLMAIADIAVRQGGDAGEPLRITLPDLAEEVIRLYWYQVREWPHRDVGVLRQNTKGQAMVVTCLEKYHKDFSGSFYRFSNDKSSWHKSCSTVVGKLKKDPVWRLQNVGRRGQHDIVDDFIYPQVTETATEIALRPVAVACFKDFYSMIRSMIAYSGQLRSPIPVNLAHPFR